MVVQLRLPDPVYRRNASIEGYKCLRSIVSDHPMDPKVSIETVIEVSTSNHQHRVRVSSGLETAIPFTHAIFSLGKDPALDLCWSSFESHKVLCVLVNPTLLKLWAVFPDDDKSPLVSSGDGWVVNLPFHCESIHDYGKGLLLQRQEDPQDDFASGISSLFSLHHPLEDVLPVSLLQPGALQIHLMTDTAEKLIWVGTSNYVPEKPYLEKKVCSQVLAVTYNQSTKRHSIWSVQPAMKPPLETPLYQQTRLKRDPGNFHSHTLEDMQLLGIPSSSPTAITTRDEALADALGVRKSPRLSLEPNTRSRQRAEQSMHQTFLSPTNKSFFSEPDTTLDIHSPLQPKCSIARLFTDEPATKATKCFLVSNLAASGSLVLALQLSRDQGRSGQLDLFELKVDPTSDETRSSLSVTDKVSKVGSIACDSSGPIQAFPTPACHKPHSRFEQDFEMATDILVMKGQSMSLYRLAHRIVDFDAIDERSSVRIVHTNGSYARLYSDADENYASMKIQMSVEFPILERILDALDAFCQRDPTDGNMCRFALVLRADAVKALQMDKRSSPLSLSTQQFTLKLILAFVRELLGIESKEKSAIESSSWNLLIRNESVFEAQLPSFLQTKEIESLVAHDLSVAFCCTTMLGSIEKEKIIRYFFLALHTLVEDTRLHLSSCSQITPLLEKIMLRSLTLLQEKYRVTHIEDFFDYYQNRSSPLASSHSGASLPAIDLQFSPFSFYHALLSALSKKNALFSLPSVEDANASCARLRSLCRIFSILAQENDRSAEAVIRAIVEEGMKDPDFFLYELPIGVSLPLLEVIHECQMGASLDDINSTDILDDAWALVGRNDMICNLKESHERFFGVPSANHTVTRDLSSLTAEEKKEELADLDGLQQLEYQAAMMFPQDNRIREAARVLRSSRPVLLRVPRAVELSDHDYEKQKQKKLALLCTRVLALPVGRGMLTIGGLHKPVVAQALPMPPLSLKGKVPPANTVLAYDMSEAPADLTVWPYFHNGVSAALRLPSAFSGESTFKATRTWIIYNRPRHEGEANDAESTNSSHLHAGFLFGLGLRGYLTALDMSDLYDYLTHGTVTTTVGVLLGMAANKRGSCDLSVSKMLCLHIPSLIPQHFSAIDVASTVQTAAIAGAGLLYQSSSHRMMTEFLLNEIGKRPDSDISVGDRESHILTCGLALGMVNLCVGRPDSSESKTSGISDLNVEERLLRYALGGIDPDENRRKREANDRFSLPTVAAGSEGEKCSVVSENAAINTDVTAPGAILSLGLMHLRSGNKMIASALQLPQTLPLLEYVRPDFISLRIIANALIMWDRVEPTIDWITRQIPDSVNQAYKEMEDAAKAASDGSRTKRRFNFDRQSVRQIRAHAIAGTCFALGLRFAGTGNETAKQTLLELFSEFLSWREGKNAIGIALTPGVTILELTLGTIAISLSMIFAGTGDLEILKALRMIRWRCDESVQYGNHMVYGMAIGLLFLGGGRYTLGREPEDIAAMIMSFYPRFAMDSMDNQFHLQALRHMYVLAIKRREVVAIDVDTKEQVHVPIKIYRESGVTEMTTPCVVLHDDSPLKGIKIDTDEYYPLAFRDYRSSFYVKRRAKESANGRIGNAYKDHIDDEEGLDEFSCHGLPLYFSLLQGASPKDLGLVRKYYENHEGSLIGREEVAHLIEQVELRMIQQGYEARELYDV